MASTRMPPSAASEAKHPVEVLAVLLLLSPSILAMGAGFASGAFALSAAAAVLLVPSVSAARPAAA